MKSHKKSLQRPVRSPPASLRIDGHPILEGYPLYNGIFKENFRRFIRRPRANQVIVIKFSPVFYKLFYKTRDFFIIDSIFSTKNRNFSSKIPQKFN